MASFETRNVAEAAITDLIEAGYDADEMADRLNVREDQIIADLFHAATVMKDLTSIDKVVGMTNKTAERDRFLTAYENGEAYEPDFAFRELPWDPDTVLDVLTVLQDATNHITAETMDHYGAEVITAGMFQQFFREIFYEFEQYVKLASVGQDPDANRKASLQIWPMITDETIAASRTALRNRFDGEQKGGGELTAKQVAKRWDEELDRLGVEWTVERRQVPGCFNIPEDHTVVVAQGENGERHYTEDEAEILTMHELFHVVRAYNGIKASEASGVPPIIGMHTPFYDMTEEGGAVYREHATGVITPWKEKEYHLRVIVADLTAKGHQFSEIVETLITLGATPDRAFMLAARNREMLKHHIYHGGYYEQWRTTEDVDALLLGKLSKGYAELFEKEVAAGGMFSSPPVSADALFAPRQ